MPPHLRQHRIRWTASVLVWCVLLLQSAAPLLAHAAAQAQGKALFEVCSAYGVQLAPGDGSAPAPETDSVLHQAPCALTLLSWTAPPPAPAAGAPAVDDRWRGRVAADRDEPSGPDAFARWQAQRKQGPPLAA